LKRKPQNYLTTFIDEKKNHISCQIGGNVATNAGGLRLLRYGSLRGTVLGMEVVLPNGNILSNLCTLRKDNTGFDLKQLFLGSEGTLGVITAVSIFTPIRPKSINVALLSLDSYSKVEDAFVTARSELGETLSAFEFWDESSTQLVRKHMDWIRLPLVDSAPFSVLIETAGSNEDHDREKLDQYLERILEKGIAFDGVVSQDESQSSSIWALREGIPEACSKDGAVYKYDVSVPVPHLYSLVENMRTRLQGNKNVRGVLGYGHVGDGNLHLNVSANEYDKEVEELIEPFIYEQVASHFGSISAEHGLGIMKPHVLHYSKDENMITTMRSIKQLFDPKGIMNPYKYLPEE
jgi:FAD/FMN-containing dehydrogenase